MRKIIFDTEVILDAFITNRPDSERVMTLIEKCSGFSEENMLGMVTSTTLQDVYNFCSIANSPEVAYEGIRHLTNPWFSSQFHPEACSGPVDTEFMFDRFIEALL